MTIQILLTTPGTDSGPFNLYSDIGGFTSAFATNVSKATLLAGYVANNVPDGTTIVRLVSVGECTNYIDFEVGGGPVTTTTTTTLEPIITTTTTTTSSECITRPEGLIQNSIVSSWTHPLGYSVNIRLLTPTEACDSFNLFKSLPYSINATISYVGFDYSSLELGQVLYRNCNGTDCRVVQDGTYWFNPTFDCLLFYDTVYYSLSVQIITVVGGIVTSILNCE